MPLDDAMPFLSRNFDNFVEMMKQKISAVNEWTAPDKKVVYYLNLLADGKRLTLAELSQVDKYVQSAVSRMKSAEAASSTGVSARREEPMPEPSRSRGMLPPPFERAADHGRMMSSAGGTERRSLPFDGRDSRDAKRGGGQLLQEPTRQPSREALIDRGNLTYHYHV